MRTDHVTAWLIKQWLQANAPELASGWDFEVEDEIIALATRVEETNPQIGAMFTGQNILAKTAIDMWDLKDVALLAGGAPTPLSPRPDQLLYYTDTNPEVVAEARAAGYNALAVNVLDGSSIAQLTGAKSFIATGLFHFLTDETTSSVFAALDQHGAQTIMLSHGRLNADPEGIKQYEKMGIRMFMRDEEQLQALLPPGWQIDFWALVNDYVRDTSEVGLILSEIISTVGFYKATKTS